MSERDAILDEIATWLEEPDIIEMSGTWIKRKRDREDARLRIETSRDVRRRLADMVRGRKENKFGDPLKFLKSIESMEGKVYEWATSNDLREAFSLADKGLLLISARLQLAGPWSNCVPPKTEYVIELTDKGRDQITASKAKEQSA